MVEQTTATMEQAAEQQVQVEAMKELGELQLAVIGGGIGTVVFA